MPTPFEAITPSGAFIVTPSDAEPQTRPFDALWIGSSGNVVIITKRGETVDFACLAGSTLPQGGTHVFATGTTATGIRGMYYER